MSVGLAIPSQPASGSFSKLADNAFKSEKARKSAILWITAYIAILMMAVTVPAFAQAEGEELTQLFETTAFSGSWEVFSKFNWLGNFLNFCISAFSLIGLVFVVLRFTITILYKSNEAIFDRVYELKGKGQGTGFFGIPALGKELVSGNYGVGADVVIGFVLSLLPNIKEYSDYNPNKMMFNLKEDDTLTTYVLKMSLPTIMTIFFFSIGFNGTLWQAYGNVVGAMATAAHGFCTVQLSSFVDKALNVGSYFQFGYDTKTELGKFQKNVATNMYNKILPKLKSITSETMQAAGSEVQTAVDRDFKWDTLRLKLFKDLEGFDENGEHAKDQSFAKYLTCTVIVNSSKEFGANNGISYTVNYPLSQTDTGKLNALTAGGESDSNGYYLHVTISRKDIVNTKNPWSKSEFATNDDDTTPPADNTTPENPIDKQKQENTDDTTDG